MNVSLVTAATSKPIDKTTLKEFLRIATSNEDSTVESILDTGIAEAEHITRRAILTQTWDYYLDSFSRGNSIKIPFGNLQSVTHVKYTDSNGDQTTMTVSTEYLVETNGEQCGRIVLPEGVTWPSDSLYPSNPIVIRFVCGWTTAASVPIKIKQAIKMICAELYENRGERIAGAFSENKTAMYLLNSYRLWDPF